jgi:hypothetical protein
MSETSLRYDASPPSKRLTSGAITQGWALIFYSDKPISLLGKGSYLDPQFFQRPFELVPVGQLSIEHDVEPQPRDTQKECLRGLARHAARLSASALTRTADFFLELAEKNDPDAAGALELPLSQGQLAELLGMSCVHMNRTLRQMKKIGLLNYGAKNFEILDHAGLAELASDL